MSPPTRKRKKPGQSKRSGNPRSGGMSRVTPKKTKPVHGDIRNRKHGDHFHTERWCENHNAWEPAD